MVKLCAKIFNLTCRILITLYECIKSVFLVLKLIKLLNLFLKMITKGIEMAKTGL